MNFVIEHSYLIPLLPLIGAAIAGFFGARWLKGQSHWPIWLGVGSSAVLAIVLLLGMLSHHTAESRILFTWIEAGSFVANAGFWFDPLTAVMLAVVCGIGFLITIFAAGYMKGEKGYWRFFAYLGLFIFMMTNLVMGENLLMLYLGWEGVGLCSYLLIGYYYDKPAAREAAKKAFLVNRVGDFGFGLGIMLIFLAFGTISYFGQGAHSATPGFVELATMPLDQLANIQGVNTQWVPAAMQWAPFLLMLGAFGKSAQFPLYVWLPDAMEGPTPVSALIHAATMVTAGVYMIARCATLFVTNEAAMFTIACVGAFTAIFAATIALRQFDLKKVFAYSTVSQLGFMFVGVGALAPVAGVFHLVTHAFFKALLFLSSGVVMHAMLGHLDMRKMSGLKTQLPKTRWLILIGCAALAGFPFVTSGFYSKDEIVAAAWHMHKGIGLVMLITAFLTAYYTFRLYFRVFEGPTVVPSEPADDHGHAGDDHAHEDHAHGHASHSAVDDAAAHHGDHGHHNHEPAIMILPLVILAIGALVAGFFNFPRHNLGHFLGHSPSFEMAYEQAAHHSHAGHAPDPAMFGQTVEGHKPAIHWGVMLVSGAIALAGIGLAFVLHLRSRATGDAIARGLRPITWILEAKYWVDEIYQGLIVEPLRRAGRLLFAIDRWVVDGLVGLVSWIPQLSGYVLKFSVQRGYLQGYAAAMLLGVAVILLWMFL